jgi:hypothetical protein
MLRKKEKMGQLQKWILVEAYKNGLARKNKARATAEFGRKELGCYFIHRHDIYTRYFKLPNDRLGNGEANGSSFRAYHEVRLRNAVILCESVRRLLKKGLILFPLDGVSKHNLGDLLGLHGGSLFLTKAGVRKARSLLSNFRGPDSRDGMGRPCVA